MRRYTRERPLAPYPFAWKSPTHARHHRLLHVAQFAVDLSRQRAAPRDRSPSWRNRQRQAQKVRTDLREDRRPAAAEALAATASLPDDGVEALARGEGRSHPSRTKIFPERRRRGGPPRHRGQAAGQERASSVAGAGTCAVGARGIAG